MYATLKIGSTKIFAMTPSKLTFAKTFWQTGKIAILVAILIAKELAKKFGSLIFFRRDIILGAIAIIAKMLRKDNWKEIVNKLEGLQSKIIMPAIKQLLVIMSTTISKSYPGIY